MSSSFWGQKQASPRRDRFSTTQWSLVLAAGDAQGQGSREALALLCERYWYPLYAYVRRRGYDPDEAQDLTQGFFAQFLEKGYFGRANKELGRFRSYLLSSLKHYLANEWDRQRAQKRGGDVHIFSIDLGQAEKTYSAQPVEWETPEQVYDRRWALSQLDRAVGRLAREMEEKGKNGRFEVLKGLLTGDESRGFYATAASELKTSEGAVRVAAHRMRRRFGELLRLEIADTVAEEGKIEEEMHHLFSALTG